MSQHHGIIAHSASMMVQLRQLSNKQPQAVLRPGIAHCNGNYLDSLRQEAGRLGHDDANSSTRLPPPQPPQRYHPFLLHYLYLFGTSRAFRLSPAAPTRAALSAAQSTLSPLPEGGASTPRRLGSSSHYLRPEAPDGLRGAVTTRQGGGRSPPGSPPEHRDS